MKLSLLFLFFFTVILNAAEPLLLTDKVLYYVDKTSQLTQNTIESKKDLFQKSRQKRLTFQKDTNTTLWIHFTLSNPSNKVKYSIIECVGNGIYQAELYDFKHRTIDIIGAARLNKFQKDGGYVFKVKIAPKSSTEYYMKVINPYSTLKLEMLLWDKDAYVEAKNTLFMKLLFLNVLMGILLLYNLMIFFFTKDRAYFFYALVTLSSILFSMLYSKFIDTGYLFFYPSLLELYKTPVAQWALFGLFAFSPWFARSFLQLKTMMPDVDRYFKYLPLGFLVLTLLSANGIISAFFTLLYLMVMVFMLLRISFMLLLKGVKESRYYISAWVVILAAFLLVILGHYEFIDIEPKSFYLLPLALGVRVFILSIGLSARVHYEREKKELADAKLLAYQKEETNRLEQEVVKRTKELNEALSLKELLLKELHHRVKNNMQIIISLLRLQADSLDDERLQKMMQLSQQRIEAMSSVHELLYADNNIGLVDTKHYFARLFEKLKKAYAIHDNVKLDLETDYSLGLNQAVYVGLIVNELLINALKYAFAEKGGTIHITLTLQDNLYTLVVADDGKGGSLQSPESSLGMLLVNTLVEIQLKGEIESSGANGVKHTITFPKEEDG